MEGKFQIADSIQIECEVGGELRVGGKLASAGATKPVAEKTATPINAVGL